MHKFFLITLSVPRSVWFNFRYLPLNQAIKLPIWLAPNTHVSNMWRGGIRLENPAFNRIHIGFHVADAVDCVGSHTIINIRKGGVWIIADDAHIGRGANICVGSTGTLSVGENFAISGTTSIVCGNEISIGKNVQFSWNTLVMDGDAHKIYGRDGSLINPTGTIRIGDKVWIAANNTILKNSVIGNNCIIGANSLMNRPLPHDNCIIAGTPASMKKPISGWEI